MLHTLAVERPSPAAAPSMMVLTDTNVLTSVPATTGQTVQMLQKHDIPIVLISSGAADDVHALQSRLAIKQPFIAAGGGALWIPTGYFERKPGAVLSADWNVIEFAPQDSSVDCVRALRLLSLLYWRRREDGLVVGITDRRGDVLQCADVPIIVRNPSLDQEPLRTTFRFAYVTESVGCAGWAEAIVGAADA